MSPADASELLWKVCPPIILCLGTFGNLMTLIILRTLPLGEGISSNSMSVLFAALAVSDLLILHAGLLPAWLWFMWGIDVKIVHDVTCKMSVFLLYFSGMTSAWFVVAMTLQRVASVLWPHRVGLLCSRRKAWVTLLVVVVVVVFLNAHLLAVVTLREPSSLVTTHDSNTPDNPPNTNHSLPQTNSTVLKNTTTFDGFEHFDNVLTVNESVALDGFTTLNPATGFGPSSSILNNMTSSDISTTLENTAVWDMSATLDNTAETGINSVKPLNNLIGTGKHSADETWDNFVTQDNPVTHENPMTKENPTTQKNPITQENPETQEENLTTQGNPRPQENPESREENPTTQGNPVTQGENPMTQDNTVSQKNPTTQEKPSAISLRQCLWVDDLALQYYDAKVFPWVDLVVSSALPFLLLLISNSVLACTLVRSARLARSMAPSGSCQGQGRVKAASSVTWMVLSVSMTFLVLTLPLPAYLIKIRFFVADSPEEQEWRVLAWAVVNLLWYLNSALNFYLYCLTGTKFRAQCKRLLSCAWGTRAVQLNEAAPRTTELSTSVACN